MKLFTPTTNSYVTNHWDHEISYQIRSHVHWENSVQLKCAPCLVGGAENSGPRGSPAGGAGEEELRAGAGQAGERETEPGEAGPGGQGLWTVPAGGRLRGDAGRPQAGPGQQGGGAEPQAAVSGSALVCSALARIDLKVHGCSLIGTESAKNLRWISYRVLANFFIFYFSPVWLSSIQGTWLSYQLTCTVMIWN